MLESATIARQIDGFLSNGRLRRIWFASHTDEYPRNAFLVKFARMVVVLEGTYLTAIGHRGQYHEVEARQGDVIYIPSQTWDLPDWNTRGKVLTLLFGHYQIGMSLTISDHQAKASSVVKYSAPDPMQQEGLYLEKALCESALAARDNGTAACIAEGLLRYCRGKIEDHRYSHTGRSNDKWRAISMYLQKNFSAKITRESVALEYGISPNHLSRLFREEGGMGFNEYLTLVRIDRAKMLLSQYQMNMSEIAARTGFKDSSYMGRVFRKHTGMTLGEYRAKYAA